MTDTLRAQTIRLAQARPDLRADLLSILTGRVAKEFSSQDALDAYLKDHPQADKSKHWIKGEGDEGKSDDEESEGKSDKGKGKVEVKVDTSKLEERRPKIDSEDLSKYPDDVEADDLDPEHREEISDYKLTIVGDDARQAVEIARKVKEGIAKGSDICKLNPPICEANMGLTRDKMPQIEGEKSVKQMLESSNELDRKKGKAMVEAGADPEDDRTVLQQMLDHLAENGVRSDDTTVPVGSLKATQSEIKAEKVYGMADAHLKGKFSRIDDSVVVSRDGHILDGHHRWAALLTIDPAREMKVKVIDMDMKDLLKEAQAVPGVYKADFEGNPLGEDDQKTYKSEAKSSFKPKGKKAMDLRAKLIRLAYQRPEFRTRIMPLVASTRQAWDWTDDDRDEMLNQLRHALSLTRGTRYAQAIRIIRSLPLRGPLYDIGQSVIATLDDATYAPHDEDGRRQAAAAVKRLIDVVDDPTKL